MPARVRWPPLVASASGDWRAAVADVLTNAGANTRPTTATPATTTLSPHAANGVDFRGELLVLEFELLDPRELAGSRVVHFFLLPRLLL